MTLIDLFDLSLRGRAGAPALDFGQETYTFGELDDRSNRLAQFLLTEGVRPGDRLCVYLANCVEMIELYLACVKTGVIFVPINILYRDREISHILRDAEPRAVISDEPLAASTTIWTRAQVRAAIQGNWPTRPAVRLDADSPAGINLHLRNNRNFEGGCADAQQLRRERLESPDVLADYVERSFSARVCRSSTCTG
jgi:malonyl-CoA/methylmalonyl-CoA synthetase